MIRVGIVDSGIDGEARTLVVASADFAATGERLAPAPGRRDRCGHGSVIARIVATAPGIELLDARIFHDALRADARAAAAAIEWLLAERAQLVNLSFGLRDDRAALREACARAIGQGVLLVASAPARGAAVFPASYPGVVRATGDARCSPVEISALAAPHADFGGCVRAQGTDVAGASIGCAHVTAALAAWLSRHPDAGRDVALLALQRQAAYHGPERRGHP